MNEITRTAKMKALEAAGWKRYVPRPKEPTYWLDPLGLLGYKPRTNEAYDLLMRRQKNGIGK